MTSFSKKDFMTEEEFTLIRDLVQREFGILLKGDKRLTLHAKVSHRLEILGLESYRDYHTYIVSDSTRDELFRLASHITNNETYFFREKAQLDVFSGLLSGMKRERQSRSENELRVLSLACSSGEEAYSLNIVLQENGLFAWDWDVRITGMDIDRSALAKAKEASYSRNSFRLLNGDRGIVDKYFSVSGDRYVLRRSLLKNVEFVHGNVLEEASFAGLQGADAIFCRNVLIYMSDEAIERLIGNLYNVLADSGYLFIGSAESLIQKTNLFLPEYVGGIIAYRKNGAARASVDEDRERAEERRTA
jgi:chemotaxis protein methyltransferase CheR